MQEYNLTLKDEDGQIYTYNYHKFTWTGPLMIYKAGGLTNDGQREMILIAKFQNCRAILDIGEVDEDEG